VKTVTKEEVEGFLQKVGKQGEKVLNVLGNLLPVAKAMESDFGLAFLSDLQARYVELLNKVVDLTATEEEKIEMKVTKNMLMKFAIRINAFNERIDIIKEKSA